SRRRPPEPGRRSGQTAQRTGESAMGGTEAFPGRAGHPHGLHAIAREMQLLLPSRAVAALRRVGPVGWDYWYHGRTPHDNLAVPPPHNAERRNATCLPHCWLSTYRTTSAKVAHSP